MDDPAALAPHPNPSWRPTSTSAGRRALTGAFVVVLVLLASATAAAAGGWAVSTLDETPVPVPGEPVDVGFTVLQHGVTPVDVAEGVGIEITSSVGTVQRFPAEPSGAPGHYVASVVFPEAGDYTWSVQQGMFAPQDLGGLTVGQTTAAGTDDGLPSVVRFGLPALAIVLAAVAMADLVVGRRRRRDARDQHPVVA